jgi:SMC interacting uncharacterized protein involved in chromosome segregation
MIFDIIFKILIENLDSGFRFRERAWRITEF